MNAIKAILRVISKFSFLNYLVVYDSTFGNRSHTKSTFDFLTLEFPRRNVVIVSKTQCQGCIPLKSAFGFLIVMFSRDFAVTVSMPSFVAVSAKNVVQFWHGTCPKNFGLDDKSLRIDQINFRISEFNGYTKIVYYNQILYDTFVKAFLVQDLSRLCFAPTPYILDLKRLRDFRRKQRPERLKICYAPTHRRESTCADRSWDLSVNPLFLNHIGQIGASLEVCYHPSDELYAGADIFEALQEADVVISDYSSLLVDLQLVGFPVLMFCEDLSQYLEQRGIDFSVMESVGVVHTDVQTLIQALNVLNFQADDFLPSFDRHSLVSLVHDVYPSS